MADEKAAPKKQPTTKQDDAPEALGPQSEPEEIELTPRIPEADEISPADLELGALAQMPAGETIRVKVNPETPSPQQVAAATSEVPGPPVTKVTIESEDEITRTLRPDDAALISQRVGSDLTHPAHTSKGHWANPSLADMTDEEREANEKAYAGRFG